MRVIPCIVIQDGAAFFTRNHKSAKYVGDPLNLVKILSELEVDEIAIVNKGKPCFNTLKNIGKYSRVPLSITNIDYSLEVYQELINFGFDRIGLIYEEHSTQDITSAYQILGRSSLILNLNIDSQINPQSIIFQNVSEVIIHDVANSGSGSGLRPEIISAAKRLREVASCCVAVEGGWNGDRICCSAIDAVYFSRRYLFKDTCLESMMVNKI